MKTAALPIADSDTSLVAWTAPKRAGFSCGYCASPIAMAHTRVQAGTRCAVVGGSQPLAYIAPFVVSVARKLNLGVDACVAPAAGVAARDAIFLATA